MATSWLSIVYFLIVLPMEISCVWYESSVSLPTAIYNHVCGYYNNSLHIVGGKTGQYSQHSLNYSNYIYYQIMSDDFNNITNNIWQKASTPNMSNIECKGQCYSVLDNKIFIFNSPSLVIYNMQSFNFMDPASYQSDSIYPYRGACVANDGWNIFLVGGDCENCFTYRTIQIYDLFADVWEESNHSLLIGRSYSGCLVSANGSFLYIFGGYSQKHDILETKITDTIEEYDILSQQVSLLTITMLHKRIQHFVISNVFYRSVMIIVGGYDGYYNIIPQIELFYYNTARIIYHNNMSNDVVQFAPFLTSNMFGITGGIDSLSQSVNTLFYYESSAVPCNNYAWCYYADIYPSINESTTNVTASIEYDSFSDAYIDIHFNIHSNDCFNPAFTFDFELLDYNYEEKYIQIFDTNGIEITKCIGPSFPVCNKFTKCITNCNIQPNKIEADSVYKISLYLPGNVAAACALALKLNARLTLSCFVGSQPKISECHPGLNAFVDDYMFCGDVVYGKPQSIVYSTVINQPLKELQISSCGTTYDTVLYLYIRSETETAGHLAQFYDYCDNCGNCTEQYSEQLILYDVPAGVYYIELAHYDTSFTTNDLWILSMDCNNQTSKPLVNYSMIPHKQTPSSSQWTTLLNIKMPQTLFAHVMAYWNDSIYIIGGIYSPKSNSEALLLSFKVYYQTYNASNINDWMYVDIPSIYKIECWADCYVQIDGLIYIMNVKVMSCPSNEEFTLYIYNLSALAFVDLSSYKSKLSATLFAFFAGEYCVPACLTTNKTHIFMVFVQEIVIYDVVLDEYSSITFGSPLFAASACSIDVALQSIYIMGGIYDGQKIYKYDLENNILTLLIEESVLNQYNSRIVTTNDNYMVVFGGLHYNDDYLQQALSTGYIGYAMEGGDTTDLYRSVVFDANTNTFFNLTMDDYYPYAAYLYDANNNVVLRSGGWQKASVHEYKDTLFSMQMFNAMDISTHLLFAINHTISPGNNLMINYTVIGPKSVEFMQYPLQIQLYSNVLSVDAVMVIPSDHECTICAVNCVACSFGLFVQISSANMIGNQYNISTHATSAGLLCDNDLILSITTCQTGYKLNENASAVNCVKALTKQQIATIVGTAFGVLFVILCAAMIFVRHEYMRGTFIVDKTLVLLIGISEFEEKTKNLHGVKQNIVDLVHLWRECYHYKVEVCPPYSSKTEVQNFIDAHKYKIEKKNCVIVHVISHGGEDYFETSDSKLIYVDFIKHELISASEFVKNRNLIKLIFHHACRGDTDYNMPTTRKHDPLFVEQAVNRNNSCCRSCQCWNKSQSLPALKSIEIEIEMARNNKQANILNFNKNNNYSNSEDKVFEDNCATIYGNIKGRALSDLGHFTKCICQSFKNNLKQTFKQDFNALVAEIRQNLKQKTNSAEIMQKDDTMQYSRIRFEMSKNITNKQQQVTI